MARQKKVAAKNRHVRRHEAAEQGRALNQDEKEKRLRAREEQKRTALNEASSNYGKRKDRPGPPSKPLLGKRTTIPHRLPRKAQPPKILDLFNDLTDKALGADSLVYLGVEVENHSFQASVMLILRFFFNPCLRFYSHKNLIKISREFLHENVIEPGISVIRAREFCYRVRNDKVKMKSYVTRYGPAFIPRGIVFDNVPGSRKPEVIHLHRIPMIRLRAAQDAHVKRNFPGGVYKSKYFDGEKYLPIEEVKPQQVPLKGAPGPKKPALKVRGTGPKNKPAKKDTKKKDKKPKGGEIPEVTVPSTQVETTTPPGGKSGGEGVPNTTTVVTTSTTEPPHGPNWERNKQRKAKGKAAKLAKKSEQQNSSEGTNSGGKNGSNVIKDIHVYDPTAPFTSKTSLKGVTVHKAIDLNSRSYLDAAIAVECNGAPFCGYVSVDLAAKVKVDRTKYETRLRNPVFNNDPYAMGSSDRLIEYASELGYNLMVLRRFNDGGTTEDAYVFRGSEYDISENYYLVHKTENFDVNADWILLLHTGEEQSGHFMPMVSKIPNLKKTRVPTIEYPVERPWFFSIKDFHEPVATLAHLEMEDRRAPNHVREKLEIDDTYTLIRVSRKVTINPFFAMGIGVPLAFKAVSLTLLNLDNLHKFFENVNNSGEDISEDTLGGVLSRYFFRLLGSLKGCLTNILQSVQNALSSFVLSTNSRISEAECLRKYYDNPRMLDDCLQPSIEMKQGFVGVQVAYSPLPGPRDRKVINAAFASIALTGLGMIACSPILSKILNYFESEWTYPTYTLVTKEYIISNVHTQSLDNQLQVAKLDNVNWLNMLRMRHVNTDVEIQSVLTNTKFYMEQVCNHRRSFHTFADTRGLIAYNTPNVYSYVDRSKLPIIAANQKAGMSTRVHGTGRRPNHIKSIKFVQEHNKTNVPIAVAPIGVPHTVRGPIGPGILPVTDQVGIVMAFAGRSMTKEYPNFNSLVIQEFILFSQQFLEKYIEGTDVSGLFEMEPTSFFREHYRGKRSQVWIEGQILQYEHYLNGVSSNSFDSHSAFVKLENAAKLVGEVFLPKPRLIMTMSPIMLMICCQMAAVIERWNLGEFSKFQVKEKTVEEMIRMITEASDQEHCATDYSSFEASVMGEIRQIENYVIRRLLYKAGFSNTLSCFDKYVDGPRILKSNGVTMEIDSRCSGDPHTSMGNGIVNVCINAFCVYKALTKLGHDSSIIQRLHPYEVNFDMVAEGDDALISSHIPIVELITSLGFSFSTAVRGNYEGDCDFLRKRWIDGKCYLNVARHLNVFWVKNKANLSQGKLLFLLRCMGCSLHYLSPGHPIICSIVNRIGTMTSGVMPFKNWFLHLDLYKYIEVDIDKYPSHVEPDESMRRPIAEGALGFPPIPIPIQIELERIFEHDPAMYIGELLSDYEEVRCYESTLYEYSDVPTMPSESVLNVLMSLLQNGCKMDNQVISSYGLRDTI